MKELDGQPQAPWFPIEATQFNGSSAICINATSSYLFPDPCKLPSNVIWSLNNTNAQILSSNSNSVTLKGISNGSVTLTASFQNGQTFTKTIWIGVPQFSQLECSSNQESSVCDGIVYESPNNLPALIIGNSVKAIFNGITPNQTQMSENWEWERINQLSNVSGNNDRGTIALLDFGNTGFRVRAKNDCGWSEWSEWYFDIVSTGSNIFYQVSPNPTSNNITIDLKDKNKKPKNNTNKIAKLYDNLGNQKVVFTIIENKATASISNLPTGIYHLKIIIDNEMETHIIIKNH